MTGIETVAQELVVHGLIIRGGFNFELGEDAPAKAVLLVGHGGAEYWTHFQNWHRNNPQTAEPLDTWSRIVIDDVARSVGARAVYPNDRPYLPFQQWAMRAEGLRPSPLGILMHPRFGLWHAYRGALLFDHEISIQHARRSNHICDLCVEKPCLNSCPVDAFTDAGYAVERCRAHVRSEGATCRSAGCIARNACPHDAFRYPPDVQAFHMAAFV
ncbi:hypothetical protein [Aliihoeflea sp. PC F10.4]